MMFADSFPSINAVWIVLIALFSVGANVATIILAIAAFRKQKTEVSFSDEYTLKHDFENHVENNDTDSRDQWNEINQIKRTQDQLPDRIISLLKNTGVIK